MANLEQDHLQSDDDIEHILRIAVSKAGVGDDLTLRSRLMATASELGLTDEQVRLAEKEWKKRKQDEMEMAEFTEQQRASFWSHYASYVIVNLGLVSFDFWGDGRLGWAFWPVLGWGIGLAFHAVGTFFRKTDMFQEEFDSWRSERRRTIRKGRRREADDDD